MQVWIFILIAELWLAKWKNNRNPKDEIRKEKFLDVADSQFEWARCQSWLDTNESAVETEHAVSQWWLERFILLENR